MASKKPTSAKAKKAKDTVIKEMNSTLAGWEKGDGHRLTKIMVKTDKVKLNMELKKNGEILTAKWSSADKAEPELYKAMADLGKAMRGRIKNAIIIESDARCQGVSLDYDEHEALGMICTLIVPVNDMSGVISINTPRLKEKLPNVKGGPIPYMTDTLTNLTKAVMREAEKYMSGARAQQSMELSGKDKAAGEKESKQLSIEDATDKE